MIHMIIGILKSIFKYVFLFILVGTIFDMLTVKYSSVLRSLVRFIIFMASFMLMCYCEK